MDVSVLDERPSTVVIDVLAGARRDLPAARMAFTRTLRAGTVPVEATTDRAPVYPRAPERANRARAAPRQAAREQPVEADHGPLNARLRPIRGLKRHRSAQTVAAGNVFVQNLHRGHYTIAADEPTRHRLRLPFDELARAI